jgi:Ca2+-binding RTX toxin-like protein
VNAQGQTIEAPWDPLQFKVTPVDGDADGGLDDADAGRGGKQVQVTIDISRAGVKEGDFNAYLKFVSDATIQAANGRLFDLDNKPITTAGWYDFTRHQNAEGQFIGDGARYLVSNGEIVGIELTLTDNAFGDSDLTDDVLQDPGMPVRLAKKTPVTIHSSKNVTLSSDVDNLILDNKTIGSASDLSCLPDWLKSSVKASQGGAVKIANLNGIGNALDNNMVGNDGNNQLSGLLGDDTLFGLNGNDVLLGGSGSDTLNGGNGKDVYRYLELTDSSGANRDVIQDFSPGDKLDLRKLDANALKAGNQAFQFIEAAPFTQVAGQLRFAVGLLQADTNGDGSADFEIELTGLTQLAINQIQL